MHIASIGIDLGKTTFHLVALGEQNKILLRRKFSRSQLLAYTANLPASLVGLEACAGAHFLGTVLREQGHQVRLVPAQPIHLRKNLPTVVEDAGEPERASARAAGSAVAGMETAGDRHRGDHRRDRTHQQ